MRIKAVLDNGVEIRELLLDAEMTHQLTGINLEKAKEMAHEALDQGVVLTEFEGMITGKYFEVSGNNTGRYLIVKTITPVTITLNAAEIEAAVEVV